MARLRQKTLKPIAAIGLLYVAFFAFILATDPNKLPIGWLLVPFILLFAALFSSFIYIQRRRARRSASQAKGYATAAILAAIPTFLLLLDSIDQLTLSDAVIFIVFAVVALFYARRLSFGAREQG